MGISFGWRHAGLVSLWAGRWTLHLGVRRDLWEWGHRLDYDSAYLFEYWGLGPLFLLVRD